MDQGGFLQFGSDVAESSKTNNFFPISFTKTPRSVLIVPATVSAIDCFVMGVAPDFFNVRTGVGTGNQNFNWLAVGK